ncbi:MAG: DNA ligase, partial [Candidatus Methylarchaceae archaeon HK01M]|nr:DNA ligase [Candidatus Methylarchaceae archaeon HK01M]
SKAEAFLTSAMRAGHEGLMVKSLNSNYVPGMRGKKWFKIKPFESLDLIIIAADWGYGRRHRWLSNYYLAALNPDTQNFELVGKTFKGLTDEEFENMTQRLQNIKLFETKYTVHVKPEIVVEVAFNEIQRSTHYESGFALRFARITRIRDDKGPIEVDTIERIGRIYEKQFKFKGKLQIRNA